MELIGGYIADVLENIADDARIKEIKRKVLELTGSFPIYKG
jgi:glycine/serine hydroxymethyltransferase